MIEVVPQVKCNEALRIIELYCVFRMVLVVKQSHSNNIIPKTTTKFMTLTITRQKSQQNISHKIEKRKYLTTCGML